ncbi:hypothetical protein KO02_21930 [Sphingobacterium sp. ML3W]|uniref:MliC family protein n=1 Tax=Sphingobacterium sp. ML3W TaxID=1538644 RepID=UPI0004F7061D|nr:MliC family protein [Sphingobacterium sp. ML3W]AIM39046.1 hypothetical protein KO02_21930 [Sphingobacterium sp. ML3W]
MTSKFLTIAMVISVLLTACKQGSKEEKTGSTKTEQVTATPNDIATQSLADKEGNKLAMSFDNVKDIATITINGETAELVSQKPASGIWYKNDHYELRGKGNDIQLVKDGKVIFEHQDDKVEIEVKNDRGDVLNMTFNNTDGTVKTYLNGGEQIDLVAQKAASGIWYKNDDYELSGKGDKYELLKDGKTVFKN